MRETTRNDRQAYRRGLDGIPTPGLFRRAFARLFGRAQATTFHRCLALHMHVAAQRSALG